MLCYHYSSQLWPASGATYKEHLDYQRLEKEATIQPRRQVGHVSLPSRDLGMSRSQIRRPS